jgi:hypothetical protein
MQIATIGLEIAKNAFQVHSTDAAERLSLRSMTQSSLRPWASLVVTILLSWTFYC